MNPIWNTGLVDKIQYPPLQGALEVDVAIIGGGVTGLTTAIKLIEAGKSVAVLEARQVGAGSTGRSTGNLYATVSSGLAQVRQKHGIEMTKKVVAARAQAVDFIEQTIQRFAIDCDFARRPMYCCLHTQDEKHEQRFQAELETSAASGIAAEVVDKVPELPFPMHSAFRLEGQAQYNPLRYATGLAKAIVERKGHIFEQCKVTHIDASSGVVTTQAGEVRAKDIVQATHTPKGINVLQAEMQPYQEYGIASELKEGVYPDGAFWIVDDSKSIRSYEYAGKHYLIIIGGKHKTGHNSPEADPYTALEDYANAHFEVARFTHRWSAQQYQPADLLPYIGRSAHKNVYVGTGYAADGLTWGTVAAEIISKQVLGEQHQDLAEIFNPRRFTPLKSGKSWIEENAAVAKELFKAHILPGEDRSVHDLESGEGGVVTVNGDKLAVYRSPNDDLVVMSAECPHMKCLVNWNKADATWDCPCHGSRFSANGELLEGPAYKGLAAGSLEPK